MHKKFLLCRPNGGINDTLCQIQHSIEYADKYYRKLIVDRNKYGQLGDFNKFFEFKKKLGIKIANIKIINKLNLLNCYPPGIEGNLTTYIPIYRDGFIFDAISNEIISFDFKKNYTQDLLVHDSFGGGTSSFKLIENIYIKKKWIGLIKKSIPFLGETYTAIHIRHTDLETDYKSFYKKIESQLEGKKVMVCSDDSKIINFFKGNKKYALLSTKKIKGINDPEFYSIVDLVALGSASEFFYTNTIQGEISGFSLLASHLVKNKNILEGFLRERKKFLGSPSKNNQVHFIISNSPFVVNKLVLKNRAILFIQLLHLNVIKALRFLGLYYPSRFIYRKLKLFLVYGR